MKIETLLITGDKFMIDRHKFLLQELSPNVSDLQRLSVGGIYESKFLKNFVKLIRKSIPFIPPQSASKFRKTASAFIAKSEKMEQAIRKLSTSPDFILHLYGMYSPLWHDFDIPYAMYFDYTMALAAKNWQPWSPFSSQEALNEWFACERKAYHNARHIFTMSHCVKESLIQDYELPPEKVTVIGTSGNFITPYSGEKSFGSKQILFNGYDFYRKGGDILLEAFKLVRQAIPEATLVIVGEDLSLTDPGVSNPGYISSASRMQEIFLQSDLVVSPARCEPLGFFLIEAMNYGVPCIVSDQDGMPDVVDHDLNGLVLAHPSLASLATRIIDLLSDSTTLARMSENARVKVKTQMTWNQVAQSILQTIEDLESSPDLAELSEVRS